MGPLGVPELIIIFIVALVVFGPRKLPELGRSLGKSLSEFKRASNELRNTLDEEIQNEDRRAALAKSSTTSTSDASARSDDYEAPEDAYNTPEDAYNNSSDESLPLDDYRVGAGEAEATAGASDTPTATAESPAGEAETVARGQHG
jgi:sec-independent protein translocase protein TatA